MQSCNEMVSCLFVFVNTPSLFLAHIQCYCSAAFAFFALCALTQRSPAGCVLLMARIKNAVPVCTFSERRRKKCCLAMLMNCSDSLVLWRCWHAFQAQIPNASHVNLWHIFLRLREKSFLHVEWNWISAACQQQQHFCIPFLHKRGVDFPGCPDKAAFFSNSHFPMTLWA